MNRVELLVIANYAFFVLVMLSGHLQRLIGQFAEAGLLLDGLNYISGTPDDIGL